MYTGQLVFAQLMEFLPRHDFNACVRRYGGDRRPRGFSCRDQFLCFAFAQLTFRDIEICALFEKTPLTQAFSLPNIPNPKEPSYKQLSLFDI